jgi:hypothetical protein
MIKRTEVIRALVAGSRSSGLDVTAYGDEQQLSETIACGLKGWGRRSDLSKSLCPTLRCHPERGKHLL